MSSLSYILVYMFLIKVIKSLSDQQVECAVIGGFAVALHGFVRGTVDLDLVIALESQAFEKTEKALHSIGLKSRLPVSAHEVFQFRKEYIEKRNLIAWSFYDPIHPAHLVDIIITEDFRKIKTVQKTIHGTPIQIASIESLIEMKKRSGREQDLEDAKALEILWLKK